MKDGGPNALPPLTEGELGMYLDEGLDAAVRAALDRRLDANPDQRTEVERIRLAEADLVAGLDALLDDPVPDHLLALLAADDDAGAGQDGNPQGGQEENQEEGAALAGCGILPGKDSGLAE